MNKAERLKRSKDPQVTERFGGRLPPGQVLTEKFPILTVGEVPSYDLDKWDFQMTVAGNKPLVYSYKDLMELQQSKVICDIHCVTRWSKFDNEFEGVLVKDLLDGLEIPEDIRYVMVHGDYDYTANLTLQDLLAEDAILAHSYNGKPLTEKHGYPFRLVIPHLYFWKSVKWIRGFEFKMSDTPGFWEQNGFHDEGDPFKEQRFSDESEVMEEDKWKEKDFDY